MRLLFLVVPGEAAVHEESGAGGVVGFFGCQEDGHRGNVTGLTQAAKRNISEQCPQFDGIIEQFGVDRAFRWPPAQWN